MLLRPAEMADVGPHLMGPGGWRRDRSSAGGERGAWAVVASPRRKTATSLDIVLFDDARKEDATRTQCPRVARATLVDALGPWEATNRNCAETVVGHAGPRSFRGRRRRGGSRSAPKRASLRNQRGAVLGPGAVKDRGSAPPGAPPVRREGKR